MAALEQERQGQWRLRRCPIQEVVVWSKQLDPAQFQETYLKQKNNKYPSDMSVYYYLIIYVKVITLSLFV